MVQEEFTYNITKQDINELPLQCYEGPIELIETLEKAEELEAEILAEKFLGFDTESKPSFRKGEYHPIALIQLSSEKKSYLFRISKIGYPPCLKKVLEDENIVKIGLGINNDNREIKKDTGLNCNSFVDLESIAKKLKFKQRGVRALSAFFLKIRISKAAQKTNWERTDLTEHQIRYAATDSWACLMIYNEMKASGYIPNNDAG